MVKHPFGVSLYKENNMAEGQTIAQVFGEKSKDGERLAPQEGLVQRLAKMLGF